MSVSVQGYGVLGLLDVALFDGTTDTLAQGSQNLSFGYLSTGFTGFNSPGLNTFSLDFGEYSFLIRRRQRRKA